jgi:hypothetical protein
VTVRIQVVVLGPSTGGQGPNTSPDLAWTGSDGVAEVHKREAAAVLARPSAPDQLLGRLPRQRLDYFPAFTARDHSFIWTGDEPIRAVPRTEDGGFTLLHVEPHHTTPPIAELGAGYPTPSEDHVQECTYDTARHRRTKCRNRRCCSSRRPARMSVRVAGANVTTGCRPRLRSFSWRW